MSRVLIIGYGNPLRGDDGLGQCAARILSAKLPEAAVIESHQLTPEMAEPLSHSQIALFIDAAVGLPAGDVSVRRVEPSSPERAAFTHHVTPSLLLRFAEALFGHCPEAYMISAGAESLEFNETLTPAATAALEKIVQLACDLVIPRDNGI